MIDPATDTERILSESAISGITVKYIVNSHGHIDQTSGNADMKDRPVYVFTGDTLFVEGLGRTDQSGHNDGRIPEATIKNERENSLFLR